jgi:cytochrome P450
MHPIVPKQSRKAAKDLVVPLLNPIIDRSGTELHEIPLRKGTRIFINTVAYNRDPNLWGKDTHVFRPERWYDMKKAEVRYGVYHNLLVGSRRPSSILNEILNSCRGVFGAGIHACMGWRFA